ncbi:MAG: hypothetical protein ACIAXF_14180 [Phycisphaerales bacterium JB063]
MSKHTFGTLTVKLDRSYIDVLLESLDRMEDCCIPIDGYHDAEADLRAAIVSALTIETETTP